MAKPEEFRFVYNTEKTSYTYYTGAGVWVIDIRTGKVTFYPEMPILKKHAEAIKAANAVLEDIEGVKGAEELRANGTRFLTSSVDALAVAIEDLIKSGAGTASTKEEISKMNPQPEPPAKLTVVVVKR